MFERLAAMPPWAATVWERVGKTLVMQAVRRPEPPTRTTTTSWVWSMKL